ncbi:MAG: hypothetical protein P8X39_00980 [Desulfofustis sp.]
MKSTALIFLLMIVASLVQAQGTVDSAVPEEESQQQHSSGEDTGPPPVAWPKPFKPSQEIGADSQISFPTDI